MLKIDPFLYLGFAVAVLLLPLRLVLGWIVAVFVHECCHYIALKMCKIRVDSIHLSLGGVSMQVEDISGWREIICALAGPIGGASLVLLRKWMPCAAICALLHSSYNLLPIFSLDGGRALNAILKACFGAVMGQKIHHFVSSLLLLVLIFVSFCVCIHLKLPLVYLVLIYVFFAIKCVGKFPCKRLKQIVQ